MYNMYIGSRLPIVEGNTTNNYYLYVCEGRSCEVAGLVSQIAIVEFYVSKCKINS